MSDLCDSTKDWLLLLMDEDGFILGLEIQDDHIVYQKNEHEADKDLIPRAKDCLDIVGRQQRTIQEQRLLVDRLEQAIIARDALRGPGH